jgi:hypothetical protein
MADYRLKIKIGEHEFEAEGPTDVVQSQLEIFKELVSRAPVTVPEKPKPEQVAATDDSGKQTGGVQQNGTGASPLDLEKIMRADGRVISLTVRAETATDAVLLLMLGQRQFRSNDSVTGAELAEGLRESGYASIRGDHVTDRLANQGAVITIGAHRGRRYRMTNAGVARAQDIARALIALVP